MASRLECLVSSLSVCIVHYGRDVSRSIDMQSYFIRIYALPHPASSCFILAWRKVRKGKPIDSAIDLQDQVQHQPHLHIIGSEHLNMNHELRSLGINLVLGRPAAGRLGKYQVAGPRQPRVLLKVAVDTLFSRPQISNSVHSLAVRSRSTSLKEE